MGGDITLESKEGEGTTFRVRIPMRQSGEQTQIYPSRRKLSVSVTFNMDFPGNSIRNERNNVEQPTPTKKKRSYRFSI